MQGYMSHVTTMADFRSGQLLNFLNPVSENEFTELFSGSVSWFRAWHIVLSRKCVTFLPAPIIFFKQTACLRSSYVRLHLRQRSCFERCSDLLLHSAPNIVLVIHVYVISYLRTRSIIVLYSYINIYDILGVYGNKLVIIVHMFELEYLGFRGAIPCRSGQSGKYVIAYVGILEMTIFISILSSLHFWITKFRSYCILVLWMQHRLE